MKKALIFSFILILSIVSLFAMTSAGSTFNGFSGIKEDLGIEMEKQA